MAAAPTCWGSPLRLDRPVHPMWVEVELTLGCYVSGRLPQSVPAWYLPGHELDELQVKLGDLALVEHEGEGVWCAALNKMAAGPDGIGLSCCAAAAIGAPQGAPGGVSVTVLPGSRGTVQSLSYDDLQSHGRAAARAAGLRLGE